MSDAAELLLDLKDIHEPLAPATSSALILGLTAVAGVLAMATLIAYLLWRRKSLNRVLQQEISLIRTQADEIGLHQLAVLLRRVMHHMHGDSINQLQNEQWLNRLDNTFTTKYFSQGRGTVFGESLYQPNNNAHRITNTNLQQLCTDLHKLIGRTQLRPHA